MTNYHIRKYGSKFKRNFLINLLNKQGFSLFYGSMKNKYLKKIVSILKTKSSKKKNTQSISSNKHARKQIGHSFIQVTFYEKYAGV